MQQFGFTDPVSVSLKHQADLAEFAGRAVRQAGAATLPYFRTGVQVDNKLDDGFDPVTEADRAAERVIREQLAAHYPEHGILGEEYGYEPGNGLTWVIDPIDGTRAFMSGMLHWGVLLGLFDGQQPIVGAMYQPFVDELFTGYSNQAFYERNGHRQQLRTSTCSELSDAVLATTGVEWFEPKERSQFERLREKVRMYRFGGDCYLHAIVAMGFVDVGTDAGLNAYDIQGLIPIVRAAGGVVSTYEGGNPAMGGAVVTCANEALHAQVLDAINAE